MEIGESPIIRIAVPSEAPGGMDSARSGQFGRSPTFTIVDILDGSVNNVNVVANDPGDPSGWLSPVLLLGERMVDLVIVAGIDKRPLLHCLQAGIRVFAGEDRPDVRSVIDGFLEAELSPIGPDAMSVH
jgi:predicted Fe-Mo cluster-binding NifX family protein